MPISLFILGIRLDVLYGFRRTWAIAIWRQPLLLLFIAVLVVMLLLLLQISELVLLVLGEAGLLFFQLLLRANIDCGRVYKATTSFKRGGVASRREADGQRATSACVVILLRSSLCRGRGLPLLVLVRQHIVGGSVAAWNLGSL